MSNTVHCPKCQSESLSANKKGFSGKNAAAGAILTGGIGLLAGTVGSNKIVITCLNCGHQWRPGQPSSPKKEPSRGSRIVAKVILIILGSLSVIIAIAMLFSRETRSASIIFALIAAFCILGAVAKSQKLKNPPAQP